MTITSEPGPAARPSRGAADLLRGLGLFVDGPVLWGRPVRSSGPGIFVIELGAPSQHPNLDPDVLRAWLERTPGLRIDGSPATVGELSSRLASFWLPGQTVVYAWYSTRSIGARLAAMQRTALGEARPNPAGQWLKTLREVERLRVWWAETDAPEEYADAFLAAFAAGVDATASNRLPTAGPILPWANETSAVGERRATGIEGAVATETGTERRPAPGGPERQAPASASPAPARTGVRRRSSAPTAAGATERTHARRTRAAAPVRPPREAVPLTAEGLDALRAELHDLSTVRRPQILGRIKAARELGDLSENADYESARHEQSLNEGRIQTLQDRLERAVVIDVAGGHLVDLGSTVVVASDHEGEETFTIVGSVEADPEAGRISNSSPIGRTLLGHRAGDEVVVTVPAGAVRYRIVEVR